MHQTIKTLSLEQPDSEGFQTISFEKVDGPPSVLSSPQVLNPRPGAFSYPRSTWDSLMNDPTMRIEWERVVEERVAARLALENEPYRQQLLQSAREEGIQQGIALAQNAIEGSRHKMDLIAKVVADKYQSVLHSHERAWGEAMGQLLQRFLVPNAEALATGLKGWLAEALEGFATKGTVRVRISAVDYDQIYETMARGDRWELVRDESLAAGEVHAETDAGGIFFSPSQEAEKLQNLISEFFPSGGASTHA